MFSVFNEASEIVKMLGLLNNQRTENKKMKKKYQVL